MPALSTRKPHGRPGRSGVCSISSVSPENPARRTTSSPEVAMGQSWSDRGPPWRLVALHEPDSRLGQERENPALCRVFSRCPQRDSNPRYGLERAATWAASRWGPAGQHTRAPEKGDRGSLNPDSRLVRVKTSSSVQQLLRQLPTPSHSYAREPAVFRSVVLIVRHRKVEGVHCPRMPVHFESGNHRRRKRRVGEATDCDPDDVRRDRDIPVHGRTALRAKVIRGPSAMAGAKRCKARTGFPAAFADRRLRPG